MTDIRVQPVDERDSSWESPDPRFRVYLHGSPESETRGWTATYDITGADVLQVIDWAQRQAGDSLTYAVALVYDDRASEARSPGHGRGLVWLVGMDGNDSASQPGEADKQRRMLARRRQAVHVPAADTMPPGVADADQDGAVGR